MKYIICDIDGTFADSSARNKALPAYTGKSVTAAQDRAEIKAGTVGTVMGRHEKEGCNQTIVSMRWHTENESTRRLWDSEMFIDKSYLWDDFMAVTGQSFTAWHEGMEHDLPIWPSCYALKAMRPAMLRDNIGCLWLTSRWNSFAHDTKAWLSKQGLIAANYPDIFQFRPDGDDRKDQVMKGEIIDRLEAAGHEFVLAFEDRAAMAEYFRNRNIPVFHVASNP